MVEKLLDLLDIPHPFIYLFIFTCYITVKTTYNAAIQLNTIDIKSGDGTLL